MGEYDPVPPASDATELTVGIMNYALMKASREHGYCLCIHPMMNVINFSGMSCRWCLQPVTDAAWGPEAKAIRTAAIKAAYPQFVKDGPGEPG
jgi:hypothetical protein